MIQTTARKHAFFGKREEILNSILVLYLIIQLQKLGYHLQFLFFLLSSVPLCFFFIAPSLSHAVEIALLVCSRSLLSFALSSFCFPQALPCSSLSHFLSHTVSSHFAHLQFAPILIEDLQFLSIFMYPYLHSCNSEFLLFFRRKHASIPLPILFLLPLIPFLQCSCMLCVPSMDIAVVFLRSWCVCMHVCVPSLNRQYLA